MSEKKESCYAQVDPKQEFPQLEKEILSFWKEEKIFEKSVNNRHKTQEYVFYDGPPFATGLPHYGHILTSYIKDTVPRYQTMKGKRVERRFGWDCHGLPAEYEVEKELGISGKLQIEDYGVEKFNEKCKKVVLKCTDDWEHYVSRMGRWVDFENSYKTMDMNYTESILWVFKTLYDKGYIYEGNKVVPYCCRCETPLSNFETKTDDSYRMKQDPSITIRFQLKNEPGVWFLAWTTTPWTLPSNLALAVGPEIEYARFRLKNGEIYIMALELMERYAKEFGEVEILEKKKGKELEGIEYEPLFPYFASHPGAFRILVADYVSCEDGTGIVHQAPAFGEDDNAVCTKAGIQLVCPIDQAGRFTAQVSDFHGQNVHDANKDIIRYLKEAGKLIQQKTIDHSYPHCWRDDKPLIYKSISSWFVNVTKIKEQIIKNNEEINWIPSHIKYGSFGKWLEGARDWAITRNRYWGAPIPVWKCNQCSHMEVLGSVKEVEERSKKQVTDLHRPAIDHHEWACPHCGGRVKRVNDVLDCWFESGSMPVAQVHYPFENKEFFERNFPADFIVEYIGQTRCWFYNMMVISTALFDKPSFYNVICHGVVLGSDGRKMSKRLKNYPDPMEMFNRYGSDSMRWFLLGSPVVRGMDLRVSEEDIKEVVKSTILPIWNVFSFFVSYANIDGYRAQGKTDSKNLLDRYILSEYELLVEKVTKAMDAYELTEACHAISEFIVTLSNWYLRRSRRRFWGEDRKDADKLCAYETLFYVLKGLSLVTAPFLPYLSEYIYRVLSMEESVHLANWPKADMSLVNHELSSEMAVVRNVVSLGHSLRVKNRLKVRKPLSCLRVAGELDEKILEKYADVICEELNVKKIEYEKDASRLGRAQMVVNAKLLGPKLGKSFKDVLSASKSGEYEILADKSAKVASVILQPDEFEISYKAQEGFDCASEKGILVSLDLHLSRELILEGCAREIIRNIQNLRKDSGLALSDRILCAIVSKDEEMICAVNEFREMICSETLCLDLCCAQNTNGYEFVSQVAIEDGEISIGIRVYR